jgi:large-conductance mechanosensitive channel
MKNENKVYIILMALSFLTIFVTLVNIIIGFGALLSNLWILFMALIIFLLARQLNKIEHKNDMKLLQEKKEKGVSRLSWPVHQIDEKVRDVRELLQQLKDNIRFGVDEEILFDDEYAYRNAGRDISLIKDKNSFIGEFTKKVEALEILVNMVSDEKNNHSIYEVKPKLFIKTESLKLKDLFPEYFKKERNLLKKHDFQAFESYRTWDGYGYTVTLRAYKLIKQKNSAKAYLVIECSVFDRSSQAFTKVST